MRTIYLITCLFVMASCLPRTTAEDHQKFLDAAELIEKNWVAIHGEHVELKELSGAGLPKEIHINILIVENDKKINLKVFKESIKKFLFKEMGASLDGVNINISVKKEE